MQENQMMTGIRIIAIFFLMAHGMIMDLIWDPEFTGLMVIM